MTTIELHIVVALAIAAVSTWWFLNYERIQAQKAKNKRQRHFDSNPFHRQHLHNHTYQLLSRLKVFDLKSIKKTQNSAPAGTNSAYKAARMTCKKK